VLASKKGQKSGRGTAGEHYKEKSIFDAPPVDGEGKEITFLDMHGRVGRGAEATRNVKHERSHRKGRHNVRTK